MEVMNFARPMISESTCGDYFYELNRENDHLLVLGDIGGHGNREVYKAAKLVQSVIEANSNSNIKEIYKFILDLPIIRQLGTTLFLGQFRKDLPLLHYICIGNLRLIRTNSVKSQSEFIKKQDGIVGVVNSFEPSVYTLKFNNEDLFWGFSDGVSSTVIDLIDHRSNVEDLEPFLQSLVNNKSDKNDDAIGMCIKVKTTSTYTNIKPKTSTYSEPSDIKPKKLSELAESSELHLKPPKESLLTPLEKEHLFSALPYTKDLPKKLNSLFDKLALPKELANRITMVILEMVEDPSVSLEMFINEHKIQLQTPASHDVYHSVKPLFSKDAIKFDDIRNTLIVEWATNVLSIDSIEMYEDLQEMFKFGLNEEAFLKFKDKRKQNELLSEQNKLAAMGEMIGAIAHQWRQPLNELGLNIQSLYLKQMNDDLHKSTEWVDSFVLKNMSLIEHMSGTIDDFRNFFRTDKTKSLIDIQSCIDSVSSILKAQFVSHQIDVKLVGNSFSFLGFQSEFQQALINILSNSKDALLENKKPNERHIIIEYNVDTLSILDNAGGIDASIINRVFDPYFTTKPHGKGTGIGLYMCKQILEDKLGFSLSVKNQQWAHGTGAKFEIKFL